MSISKSFCLISCPYLIEFMVAVETTGATGGGPQPLSRWCVRRSYWGLCLRTNASYSGFGAGQDFGKYFDSC